MMNAERKRVCEGWIDAHKSILFKVARVYGATHSDREDLFQDPLICLASFNLDFLCIPHPGTGTAGFPDSCFSFKHFFKPESLFLSDR